jgi:protein disulfide-isomerase A1
MPLVNEFNEETAPKIFGGDIMQHLLIFAAKSADGFQAVYDSFAAAAADHKGSTLFVLVDCDEDDNGRVLEFFGLKQEDCPSVRLIQMGDSMAKFKPETDDLSTDSFNAFIKGVESGTITKHLMSEEIPEDNSGPVFTIVGKNYEATVYDAEKDVLVEFYAPWCGHCKALEPVWEKLGKHFADNDNVIIAKSDATANEFDDVEVQGFPTLKFYPKGEARDIVDYEGGRDLEALIKFVESGGTEGNEPADDEDDYEDDEDYDGDEDDEDYDEDDEDYDHDEL